MVGFSSLLSQEDIVFMLLRQKFIDAKSSSNASSRIGPYARPRSVEMFPFPLDGVIQQIEEPTRKPGQKSVFNKTRPVFRPVTINKVKVTCFNPKTIYLNDYYGTIILEGIFSTPNKTLQAWTATSDVILNKEYGTAAMIAQANINCLAKLSSPEHLDAGVGLAEVHATLKFIKNPLNSVVQLARSFRREYKKKLAKKRPGRRSRKTATELARESIQTAADTWLGYRYAFSPLASDITGALIECSKAFDDDCKKLRRASGKSITVVSTTENVPFQTVAHPQAGVYFDGRYSIVKEQFVSSVQLYRYRPYFSDAIRLASLGLSPTQVVTLGWELIPFSFVADWFVNVGDWLRAWEPKPWIELIGSCVSHRTKQTAWIINCTVHAWNTEVLPPATIQRDMLVREIKSLALPQKPPITPGALSLFKQIDSISLSWKSISGFFGKFKKR